jgi:hypothetical protein
VSVGRTAVNRESHSPERPSVTPNARAWESPRGWALSLALISTVAVAARVAYVLWVLGPVRSGLDAIWYRCRAARSCRTGYGADVAVRGELTPTAAFLPCTRRIRRSGSGCSARRNGGRMAGVYPGRHGGAGRHPGSRTRRRTGWAVAAGRWR